MVVVFVIIVSEVVCCYVGVLFDFVKEKGEFVVIVGDLKIVEVFVVDSEDLICLFESLVFVCEDKVKVLVVVVEVFGLLKIVIGFIGIMV